MKLTTRILVHLRDESERNGSTEERQILKPLAESLSALFDAVDLADSPVIALRVYDVLACLLTMYRIEEAMWRDKVVRYEKNKPIVSDLFENAGRSRERFRKAMKELEDTCEKLGANLNNGLPDKFKHLMKSAERVIENALAQQAKEAESK